MLDQEWQSIVASAATDAARAAGQEWMSAAYEHMRPSAVYRPSLSIDGDKWCALYGEDLISGVCAFGDTPAAAMRQFDVEWLNARPAVNGEAPHIGETK